VPLRRYAAIATLFIVPSVIVEFLTGNTTLSVFRDPPSLVMMVTEYGCGAILARELARRWHKGFASILILGAVYGMFNEGVGTGGFFDPHFYALAGSGLENYGRWGGVNVVWALQIIVFHAVFSITVPIIIVDALFPDRAQDRLLSGDKSLIPFFVVLVFITGAQRIILSHLQPRVNPYAFILMIILMVLLTLAAWRFPSFYHIATRKAPSDMTLIFLALIGSLAWLVVIPRILSVIHLPIVHVVTLFCVLFLVGRLLLSLGDLSRRQRVALAAGAEGPLLAHAVASALFVPAAITLALFVAAWRGSGSETAGSTPMRHTVLLAGAAVVAAALTAVLLQRLFA
jgi:hypothetical protein